MNIYDISQKSGVSIATVSRVLNQSKNVSEKTRQKVLAVMAEEDYQPNAFARGLTLNTMQTVGLLCADSSDPYLGSAISYTEQALRAHSYDTLLCCTGYEAPQKEKCSDMMLARHVDALIFIGSNFVEPTEERNAYLYRAAAQVPVIILNGLLKGKNIYSVLCDDEEASYLAVQRLFKSGATHPLFLGRSMSFSNRRKQTGFEKACSQAGFPADASQLTQSKGPVGEVCRMLSRHYREHPFDAVLATDDELAIGALKFARKAGIAVPGDLRIIGYNNSLLSICCQPELSSIDNRLQYLCGCAVSLLMELMEGKSVPEKIEVSAELILRDTTPDNF